MRTGWNFCVSQAYDGVMAMATGPDFKIASTTTRMSDLLTYSSVFDDIYLYPLLVAAASHIIGEPFKLSSFLTRTLRGGTPAQELHADLVRGSEDAPLVGFILMIDSFREENGATRFVPHRTTGVIFRLIDCLTLERNTPAKSWRVENAAR
jgi:hypothetical protein